VAGTHRGEVAVVERRHLRLAKSFDEGEKARIDDADG